MVPLTPIACSRGATSTVKEGGRSVEYSAEGRDSVQTNKARHKEMEDVDRTD